MYDGWRRRREDFLLRKVMGPDAGKDSEFISGIFHALGPAGLVTGLGQMKWGGRAYLGRYGKGRIAYVPRVVDPAGQSSRVNPDGTFNMSLDYTNWRVPEKKDEVMTALRWLLSDGPRFSVEARRGVIAEYLVQKKKKRYLVHLVNFLEKGEAPLINVRMRLKSGEKLKRVKLISPDEGGAPKFKRESRRGQLCIEIFSLDLYAVVIIEMQ